MAHSTRRDFLKTAAGAGLAAGLGGKALADAGKRTATDWVTLGRSNVKVTRLAFGTGTYSGAAQRALGQDGFTRLVRYAYDRGIRFFETAESYHGMSEMLATALKGLPRDSYRLMTKYSTPPYGPPPAERIDMYRRQLNSEYIDILLLHCLRPPTWQKDYQELQDGMSVAKDKKIILSHGASIHGLPALRTIPGNQWLDIAMIRMNHTGIHMDTELLRDTNDIGNVERSGEAHQSRSPAGHGRDQHETGGRRQLHQVRGPRPGDEIRHESGLRGLRHPRVQEQRRDR